MPSWIPLRLVLNPGWGPCAKLLAISGTFPALSLFQQIALLPVCSGTACQFSCCHILLLLLLLLLSGMEAVETCGYQAPTAAATPLLLSIPLPALAGGKPAAAAAEGTSLWQQPCLAAAAAAAALAVGPGVPCLLAASLAVATAPLLPGEDHRREAPIAPAALLAAAAARRLPAEDAWPARLFAFCCCAGSPCCAAAQAEHRPLLAASFGGAAACGAAVCRTQGPEWESTAHWTEASRSGAHSTSKRLLCFLKTPPVPNFNLFACGL